ncbi:hypothetical protein GCM10012275_48090 [Longimycelium tulufanense]|uniref:Uncharacterized protein n=1 Tax=Longimycelium tulufanense TaxID=907463 RepID=A0A8J3CJI9_9PSEU|nr:hypothetical protein [Longimycelium tulufanense]GGM71941.1 hypothetical protein GCM10012275_48090 [Longimycelium tulufanense]
MSALHPHRVSYYRIHKGKRVLVATEDVDDFGFYLGWNRLDPVAHTAVPYAAALLEDHLTRRTWTQPGSGERWWVTVHRILPDGSLRRACDAEVSVTVDSKGVKAVPRRPVANRACRCGRKEVA